MATSTTRRDVGAPTSSLMSQNDRVNTLLLPLVVSYCSYLPRLARFASIDDNWWWPDESAQCANTAESVSHNVVIVYIYNMIVSIATCFLGGGGVVVANTSGTIRI